MFWKKEYHPQIIGCKLSDMELQTFLNEQDIGLNIVDNPTRWCAYANYYAYKKGFNTIKSSSFSYMVSLFLAGMGISASTEWYYKEEKIEYDLMDYMNHVKSEIPDEEEQIKCMFLKIFKIYNENISDYEYATERLSFKLTPSEMEKFQSVDGKTNKEKLLNLLLLCNLNYNND